MPSAPETRRIAVAPRRSLGARAGAALEGSAALRYAVVTVAALAYTIFLTWPHVAHFGTTVLGSGGDVPSGIRGLWALHAQGGNPFTTSRDLYITAPEGIAVERAVNIGNALFVGAVWVMGVAFGFVVAFNLYALAAFVLTCTATYALFDRLGMGVLPGLFAAYVFTFAPNHIEKLYGAASLAATGIVPLALLVLLHKRAAPTWRRSILVGALLAASFYLNPYLGLFTLWLALVFAVVEFFVGREGVSRFDVVRSYYVVAVTWLLAIAPAAVGWATNAAGVATLASGRSAALVGGSASPQLYLLPGPRQPWLGGPMRHWLKHHLSWEGTLFFGYTTMILAAAGLVIAVVKHRRRTLAREEAALVLFAALLLVTALWASLPDSVAVFGAQVPTPQALLRRLTTLFRVFSRFGILVEFASIILAAYALASIPRRAAAAAVATAALVVVAFELYVPRPAVAKIESSPTPVTIAQVGAVLSGRPIVLNVAKAPWYVKWLVVHPAGVVANYPDPGSPDARWAWKDAYFQKLHRDRLWDVAAGTTGSASYTRQAAADLDDPLSPGILASEGVTYVVVHGNRYRALRRAIPTARCGLRRVALRRAVRIYVVASPPVPVWSILGDGFMDIANPKLWPESLGYRWMGRRGSVDVYSDTARKVYLIGHAVSLDRPRRIDVFDGRGGHVTEWQISPSDTTFRFPLSLRRGVNQFSIAATPGPAVRGSGDERRVSVAVGGLEVHRFQEGADAGAFASAAPCFG